jgi:nucleotide-binding universal stress UspA family protein
MTKILVGYDGTERGEKALSWACHNVPSDDAHITLFTVIDSDVADSSNLAEDALRRAVLEELDKDRAKVAEQFSDITFSVDCAEGHVVDTLAEASKDYDLIALGSHHGRSVGETVSGAKGLRISMLADVPTAVIPVDWDPEQPGTGIVAGVDPQHTTDAAVDFAVSEALALDERLYLVTAWGVAPWLSRAANAMGGELYRVGEGLQAKLDETLATLKADHPDLKAVAEAVEGGSPSRVLHDYVKDHRMLVLGAKARSTVSRMVYGSTAHSTLMNLCVPTIVVPNTSK